MVGDALLRLLMPKSFSNFLSLGDGCRWMDRSGKHGLDEPEVVKQRPPELSPWMER